MKNLKEVGIAFLLSLWGTGKMLGFAMLMFICGLYLTSPAFDFITEFLFVDHLTDTFSAIFILWIGLSISICILVLR